MDDSTNYIPLSNLAEEYYDQFVQPTIEYMETNFKEVTDEFERKEGGERHIRRLSDNFFISVLYRLTGFGWYEWETALVRTRDDSDPKKFARGSWDDREVLIVGGDWRKELENKNEEEIMAWYSEHSHEKNSFETLIENLKS